MTLKLTSIAAAAGVATAGVQLFWSLASGSYSAGSRMEQMQTELKLIRSEMQGQTRLYQAQSQMYDFRLSQLEEKYIKNAYRK
ncbi:hypothetical protein CAL7716_034600 [Calothrix sp. PCC 7716]|nr:hypothetical protein CAL7716_034600 [Calothrix sp. PCC 7716]